jgi:hypothetical protein
MNELNLCIFASFFLQRRAAAIIVVVSLGRTCTEVPAQRGPPWRLWSRAQPSRLILHRVLAPCFATKVYGERWPCLVPRR